MQFPLEQPLMYCKHVLSTIHANIQVMTSLLSVKCFVASCLLTRIQVAYLFLSGKEIDGNKCSRVETWFRQRGLLMRSNKINFCPFVCYLWIAKITHSSKQSRMWQCIMEIRGTYGCALPMFTRAGTPPKAQRCVPLIFTIHHFLIR